MKRHPHPVLMNPAQLDMFDATLPLRVVDRRDELPKTARMLADLIGLDATIDLVKEEGGNELRLPDRPAGDGQVWRRLVEIIGPQMAAKLVESWQDTQIYVPKCDAALRAERNRDIVQRYSAGEPLDAIRRHYRLSRSYMFRLLKRPV